MDSRRFDGITRTLARGLSRRNVMRGLAGTLGATAGGLLTRTESVEADGDGTETTGAGGTTSASTCVPVARSASSLSSIRPPFPAVIAAGSCETPDFERTFSLFDIAAEDSPVGAATAATVYQSATTLRVDLDDLVQQTYSVIVQLSEDDDTVVACGEIGGLRSGDDLTVGIRERNSSGQTGIAWLRGTNGSTLVYVFLGRGLSTIETAAVAKGATVVTTADVNLRAEPSEDADVVAVLPEGSELTVTGSAEGEWLPVQDSESDDKGFVSAQYLRLKA
jgi:hypothetical protein